MFVGAVMKHISLLRNDHSLLGAVIEKIESGSKGAQPSIIIKTKNDERKMITVSNSKKFIITDIK